ncbi:DTX37 [Symbiodinium natans]|uniref:DTX37 protein n=1 Tax=Symbiodinium natans TaxID=878477 RepID=A0A812I5F8_9DINO|nr:DTX37 [Symbiodinium natans]
MARVVQVALQGDRNRIRRRLLHIAGPISAAYALEGLTMALPIWAAAHGGKPLAQEATRRVGAVGLGDSVLGSLCDAFALGWADAQDTLVSHAHGADDADKARDHLNCCQVWMLLLAALSSVILLQTEAILLWTGCANEQIAANASRYVLASIPGIWFLFQYYSLKKFLVNQQISSPLFWVLSAAIPCHLGVCLLLLEWSSLDPLVSMGIAFSVKSGVSFLLLAGYMSWFHPTPSCVGWWRIWQSSALTWKGLSTYAAIGVPSVAMNGLDAWAFQFLTLMAGRLQSPTELAAHVAVSIVYCWTYLMFRGTSEAATALAGAAVGQQNLGEVSSILQVSTKVTITICGMIVVCCWLGRGRLAFGLLGDELVTHAAFMGAFPCLLVQIWADGLNSLYGCVLAAFGQQGSVSVGILIFQWIVKLPFAWLLVFHSHLGTLGLWIASSTASVMNMIYNGTLTRHCLKSLGTKWQCSKLVNTEIDETYGSAAVIGSPVAGASVDIDLKASFEGDVFLRHRAQ